jgi:hypothetical protein
MAVRIRRSLLVLLFIAAGVSPPTGPAQADTNCRFTVNPCVDVHRIPRGYYHGTVYVDGYNFAPYDYVAVTYWIDGGTGSYVPGGAYTNGAGMFSLAIPPHCAYSSVKAQARSIFGTEVSNVSGVPSIC